MSSSLTAGWLLHSAPGGQWGEERFGLRVSHHTWEKVLSHPKLFLTHCRQPKLLSLL